MFHAPKPQSSRESGNCVTVSSLVDWKSLTPKQYEFAKTALRILADTGRMPATRALREAVGHGSLRDHCNALRAINAAIDAYLVRDAVREPSPTESRLVELQLQLAETQATLDAKSIEFEGLRKHLLMETARQRDALRLATANTSPKRTVIDPGYEEPIYAGKVDRSWK